MKGKLLLAATLSVATLASVVSAQNQGGPGGGGGGGRRQGGGAGGGGGGGPGGGGGMGGGMGGQFDPAQMQQRQLDRIKEQMKAPDDEWAVIQPKLEKVMKAQQDLRAGGFGGMGGRGGRGGGGGGPGGGGAGGEEGPVAKASAELRTAVEAENSSNETVASKLKAYRDARAKAEETLKSAREDLKGVLNERQQAILVLATMLE